jgi:hypothetical protein
MRYLRVAVINMANFKPGEPISVLNVCITKNGMTSILG